MGNAGRCRDVSQNDDRPSSHDYRVTTRFDRPENGPRERTEDMQRRGRSRATHENRYRRERAGGEGSHEIRRASRERKKIISKTLSMLCRRSDEVHRQRDGFLSLSEIVNWFARKRRVDQMPTIEDIESIVKCDGGKQ